MIVPKKCPACGVKADPLKNRCPTCSQPYALVDGAGSRTCQRCGESISFQQRPGGARVSVNPRWVQGYDKDGNVVRTRCPHIATCTGIG